VTPEEMSARLTSILDEVTMMTTDPRDWGRADLQGAVAVWDRLDRLIDTLTVLRRDHAFVLARRLPDQYTAATIHGAVTVHRNPTKNDLWDGHGLIGDLAETVINADGERIEAVPVDTLRSVLPACGQGATSSKWKITEVRKVLPDEVVAARHSVEWGDTLIARGPLYVSRNSRPPVDTGTSSTATV
jgi:hypothetical protein